MAVYIYQQKKDISDAYSISGILRSFIKRDARPAEFMNELKGRGLSYRKEDMLADYRRGFAIEKSKTYDAKFRAEQWFDTVFEPFRAKHGYTSKEASDVLHRGEYGLLETIEEMEEYDELEEHVWELFPDLYA